MREKVLPWAAAIVCAILSAICLLGNLASQFAGATGDSGTMVFICFLPMCFWFVGHFLTTLQNENRSLRMEIDDLIRIAADSKNAA